jgi:predicted Zn-ribbon and HTH transcriptional regulator
MIKNGQVCPKCGSTNIKSADFVPMREHISSEGLFGWECLDCGYMGKDFFIKIKKPIKIKKRYK